jgi:hypothetical protein
MAELAPELVAELAARLDAAAVEAVDALDLPDRLGLSEADKKGPVGDAAMAIYYMACKQQGSRTI